MILREKQEQRKIPIKEKVLCVMDVRILVTLDQNDPRISRRACLFLGLMMILKVKMMMKLLSISMPSLVDMNLMKITIMRMFLMKNCLFHTESSVSEVKRCVR